MVLGQFWSEESVFGSYIKGDIMCPKKGGVKMPDGSSSVFPLTNLSSATLLTKEISERREVSTERYLLINLSQRES